MDSFDDLLAPSRSALEANPFADPFAARSDSPDPWASFHHDTSGFQANDHVDAFGEARDSTPLVQEEHDSYATSSSALASQDTSAESSADADPLDAAAANESSEDESHTPPAPQSTAPTSPGFRESVSHTIEDTLSSTHVEPPRESTPPPAAPEPVPRSPKTPTVEVSAPTPTDPIPQPTREQIQFDRASTPPSTSNHSQPASPPPKPQTFYNPLDQPGGLGLDRSFAGLSLGGESLGGWQGLQSTQSAWGGPVISRDTSVAPSEDGDDDDDKPILQARMEAQAAAAAAAGAAGASATSSPTKSTFPATVPNGQLPTFVITVDDPQRVGDPIRGYTMYTVHTKTNSPLFAKSAFSVLRRYSDFLWLYETLSSNNPGVVVPPVPEKHPFGRFDTGFVQRRRAALEKCLRKIAAHPILQKDPDFKFFLESDSFALDVKHRKAEIAQEKGGVLASIGQSLAGPRFYETDEARQWFDKQKAYLDSLELQLRGLVKTIEQVSKQRAELSQAISEFAQTLADLGSSEDGLGQQLAHSLTGLAEVERKAEEIQKIQSTEDVRTVMSTADEYARLIHSVRLAFSSRIRVYHNMQSAEANVRKAKQMHEANRSQARNGTSQISSTLALVADAERRSLDAKTEFDQVSKLVKSEVARFERERIDDFKTSLEAFLDGMIRRQKELISAWETYQQTLLKRVNQNRSQGQGSRSSLDGRPVATAA